MFPFFNLQNIILFLCTCMKTTIKVNLKMLRRDFFIDFLFFSPVCKILHKSIPRIKRQSAREKENQHSFARAHCTVGTDVGLAVGLLRGSPMWEVGSEEMVGAQLADAVGE